MKIEPRGGIFHNMVQRGAVQRVVEGNTEFASLSCKCLTSRRKSYASQASSKFPT